MNQHNREKNISIITLIAALLSVVVMAVVLCAKAVSVLFKLSDALDLYIAEHKVEHKKSPSLSEFYDEDEEISF